VVLPQRKQDGVGDDQSKFDGKLEFDGVRTTVFTDELKARKSNIVLSRTGEIRINDPETNAVRFLQRTFLTVRPLHEGWSNDEERDDLICEWDPFNAVIISEFSGIAKFEDVEEGVTYRIERDDQTGYAEKVIVESKNKRKIPTIKIISKDGEELRSYNLPVGSYISIDDGSEVSSGEKMAKIPRQMGKIADITGGLPRVTELFRSA
jgi:DNA-directed RNA polymerase subunit beta'